MAIGALERVLYAMQEHDRLIHHSERGGQHLPTRYSHRLAETGFVSSVGSAGNRTIM